MWISLIVRTQRNTVLKKLNHHKKTAHHLKGCFINGDPEKIRTSDPQLRRLLLYPAELRDHLIIGRGSRIRTCDILLPKQALYQAELCPEFFFDIITLICSNLQVFFSQKADFMTSSLTKGRVGQIFNCQIAVFWLQTLYQNKRIA